VGVLVDSGDHLRVCRLHEQGPDAADECGDVANDLPRHRVGSQQTRIAAIRQGVGEGLRPGARNGALESSHLLTMFGYLDTGTSTTTAKGPPGPTYLHGREP